MSLFRTFLRPKHLPSIQKSATCSRIAPSSSQFGVAAAREGHRGYRVHGHNIKYRGAPRPRGGNAQSVEDVFVAALVRASASRGCVQHPHRITASSRAQGLAKRQRRRYSTLTPHDQRLSANGSGLQSHAVAVPALEPAPPDKEVTPELGAFIPRETYGELADTYRPFGKRRLKHRLSSTTSASLPTNYLPLAPRLVLTPEQESRPPHAPRRILPPEDEQHAEQLRKLSSLLDERTRLGLKRRKTWKSYVELRRPRPRYISDLDMHRILRVLAWVEFKTLAHSRRFFSVLEDCLEAGVKLKVEQWNTAVSYAGRWVKHTSREEVKSAVETWMQMENDGVPANNVTFNILIDVAARAGRFALADMIIDELKARNMPLSRAFRVVTIHYAGLRQDGDAVRQAFRDLVNAGEIVDTAVMNCVMLSLVRAGEPASAENVFAKMKHLHTSKFGSRAPRNWGERRILRQRLDVSAQELRKERDAHEASFFGSMFSTDEKKEEAQRAAPIHPDRRSCEILISYYTAQGANLARVKELLREIRDGEWHVHGSVYANIFRGFRSYGGHMHTDWSRENLQCFWDEFLQAVDVRPRALFDEALDGNTTNSEAHHNQTPWSHEDLDDDAEASNEDRPPYFTPYLAVNVLHAFYKCAGPKRMRQVWQQIQDRWRDMSVDEKAGVQEIVNKLSLEDSMYIS